MQLYAENAGLYIVEKKQGSTNAATSIRGSEMNKKLDFYIGKDEKNCFFDFYSIVIFGFPIEEC